MFRLLLLGEPVLHDASGAVVPVWRPAVALLALTASAAECTVARERAAGLLWPELEEAKARRALRQVLHRLRQDAGDVLTGERTTVSLNRARVTVDVLDVEHALAAGDLAAAVDRYRGEFLDSFALPGSADFEQWADARRAHLRARIGQALESLADVAEAAGDWQAALRHAQRRLELEPLSERAAARVVALHHLGGDHGRALALCDELAARFVEQIGAEPAGELAAVAQRIRRTTSTRQATSARPAAPAPAGVAARAPSPVFQLPLVGRAAEFRQLMEHWSLACSGAREVVVIGGEEGVGKTRLADDFRRRVAVHGATTLWSRAYEIERRIPYATLAGALREALHAPGLAGIDARTPVELARIVPEYATRFARARQDTVPAGLDEGRLHMLEAVRDVVDNLAYEAPLLLVVDDVQWADEASLAALNYVCRTLPHSALLLLLTVRTAEVAPDDDVMQLLHGLRREPGERLHHLTLEPLDEAAIHAALIALGREAAAARHEAGALLRETGGNALFLTELLRAGPWTAAASAADEPGPAPRQAEARRRLSALAADRLLRLPDAARRLLEAAAVLGRQFPLPLAAMLAGLDPAAAGGAMRTLLRRGLLRQVEYGYDFGHGVLRRLMLESLGAARLAELHAAAYAQLEPEAANARAAADSVGVERAHALAHHAARAGLHEQAHHWYLQTADRAIRLYAGAEAEAALRSALVHAVDRTMQRTTHAQLGHVAWIRSDYVGSAHAYGRALDLCDDAVERLQLRIRMLDAGLRGGILAVADADELAPQLAEEAAAAGPAALGALFTALAEAYHRDGRRRQAVSYAERALDAARAAGEPEPLVKALLLLARLAAQLAEPDRPLACLVEARQIAHTHGLERARLDARIEIGTELSRVGRWDDAIAELRTALAEAKRSRQVGAEIVADVNLSDLLIRRGDWQGAESVLDDGDRIAVRQDFPHADAALRLNRALLAWLRGDDAAATLAAAHTAADRAAAAGLHAVQRAACAIAVLSRLSAGDTAGARADGERMHAIGRALHANWAADEELAVIAAARLLRAGGDDDDGDHGAALVEAALDAAVSACGAALLRLELAHARAPRDPARAHERHALALAELERLGAMPLARRLGAPAAAP